MAERAQSAPRVAALVGPYLSGKTSLLESLLFVSGVISRKGMVGEGNSVGDGSPEARARQMSVEQNIAEAVYLGEPWIFIDCPGSVEFLQDTYNALMVADVAIVVTDPGPNRAIMVAPLLKFLDERRIPHIIFINRIDLPGSDVRATLEALQTVSERPLVLRALPILEGDEIVGYVDLVSERVFTYSPGQPFEVKRVPDSIQALEVEARREMLEHLADFDDQLLEKLLEDVNPSPKEIFQDLSRDIAANLIVPVLFGAAVKDQGIQRLLKALRHDTPEPATTAARLQVAVDSQPKGHVFKTINVPHLGKLSLVRIWSGMFGDGITVNGSRISGLFHLMGSVQHKASLASVGDVVALGHLDAVATGDLLSSGLGGGPDLAWPPPLAPLMAVALEAVRKGDDVKLSGGLQRLVEEDTSLTYEFNADLRQLLLWGQGDVHLQVAVDRLKNRYNVETKVQRPQIPYKETIRRSISQHGRYKRQTGGHGQFGDVHLTIEPLPRGTGFTFSDTIVGGVIPKQYIPSVEGGVQDSLQHGPLGFPIVDLKVTLTDGSYHVVDSSDIAFRTAAQVAMREGMPKCEPVLLEPIVTIEVSIPSDHTSRAQRLLSQRRGQILGFDCKAGWKGWDVVRGYLPQSEMHDLIIELRSMTMGVGTFSWWFDHLQEVVGKPADTIIRTRAEET